MWNDTPMWRASAAPPMETMMPAADITQNGTISFMMCDRPPFPHTHLRLRK